MDHWGPSRTIAAVKNSQGIFLYTQCDMSQAKFTMFSQDTKDLFHHLLLTVTAFFREDGMGKSW